ncbi:MAG TPA: hypothetical protein VIP09_07055 [Dehalococcoidia bacterium]|jgi:hypothetical protein
MPQASTKPQRGKTSSSRNAWKHGILSQVMAIDGFEDQRGWEAFRDGITDSLEPEGVLEHLLVERIAIALWKLRRLESHQLFLTLRNIGGAERDVQVAEAFRQRTIGKDVFPQVSEDDVMRAKLVRSFPPTEELNLIMRYEAHLHRLYIQNLHELEAIQIRRQGGTSPLARLDIIGAPGG